MEGSLGLGVEGEEKTLGRAREEDDVSVDGGSVLGDDPAINPVVPSLGLV